MSELDQAGLITLIYGARVEVCACKFHAYRLHLIGVAAKLAAAQAALIEATDQIKEKPNDAKNPQIPGTN
jgi:hypothetical protein